MFLSATASFVLMKRAPYSASDEDSMKLHIIVDVFKMAPLLCMVGLTDVHE